MKLYLVIGEYGEYSDTCMIVEKICDNLCVAIDYLIVFCIGYTSEMEENIRKCCVFKEPNYDINVSLESYHLKICTRSILSLNNKHNIEHYIEERILSSEFDFNDQKYNFKEKYSYHEENIFYCLKYDKELKQFVISETLKYQKSKIFATSSPLLDKLNMWFKKFFEESLYTISKR